MIYLRHLATAALLLCAALSLAAPARAADIAFFPVETPNLLARDAIAVGELLAQSYAAVSGAAVLAPSRSAPALAGNPSHEQAARALAVPEFVRTSALAVGPRIVVTATRTRADGEVVYSSRLTADSTEDLLPVSDRLARALYEQRDHELVRTHENVTRGEARAKNRVWREVLTGIRTGVIVPFARGADYSSAIAAAFDLRLEHEHFFIEFGAGLVLPTDLADMEGGESPRVDGAVYYDERTNRGSIGGLMMEVGASRFLTQGDVGLYAGAGVIPRIILDVSERASMSVYGQLGVTLPRDSSTRFSADLRFAQSVLAQELDNGREVFTSEASLHAGVAW